MSRNPWTTRYIATVCSLTLLIEVLRALGLL